MTRKEVENIIQQYMKEGGKLHVIDEIVTYRDGGTKGLVTLHDNTPWYINKELTSIHTGIPTTEENKVTDYPTLVYIVDMLHKYIDREREQLERDEDTVFIITHRLNIPAIEEEEE